MKSLIASVLVLAAMANLIEGCGIWGQLFCDYCWDGQFTSGTDSGIGNAVVTANCTVVSGSTTLYYWGTDTTSSSSLTAGYFEVPVTGASNKLGKSSAELSFMHALFTNSDFRQGQLASARVVGCTVSISNSASCPTLSLNDGTFLTTGAKGNGWTSSNVQLAQYQNSGWADIYIGTEGKRTLSVSATPTVKGQGAPRGCPSSPPPPPGLKGDPHFTGADGSHFDFTGQPGKFYCLLSDSHVQLNALYGGRYDRWGDNQHKALTWMRQLGVLWGRHTLTMAAREGASWQYGEGFMARMTVDGEEVVLRQAGESASFAEGAIEISWLAARLASGEEQADVYLVRVGQALLMRLTVRPEIALLRTSEDAVVHFDLELPKAELSDHAHGVLGQTFRSDHHRRLARQELVHSELLNVQVVPGDDAEGFLDGQPSDYEEKDLLSASSKVARFRMQRHLDVGATPGLQLVSGTASGGAKASRPRKVLAA